MGIAVLLIPIGNLILARVNILTFLLMAVIVTAVYQLVFVLFFRRTKEFAYLWRLVTDRFPFLKKFDRLVKQTTDR